MRYGGIFELDVEFIPSVFFVFREDSDLGLEEVG